MRRVLSSCSLSLEAVKHGHTISAVGVEPCTGRLYFSGGGWGGGVCIEKSIRRLTAEWTVSMAVGASTSPDGPSK